MCPVQRDGSVEGVYSSDMTGWLGVAVHGQGRYLYMNNIIHIVILCIYKSASNVRVSFNTFQRTPLRRTMS